MDVVLFHASQECDGAANVDTVVLEGLLARLANSLSKPRVSFRVAS